MNNWIKAILILGSIVGLITGGVLGIVYFSGSEGLMAAMLLLLGIVGALVLFVCVVLIKEGLDMLKSPEDLR